MSLSDVTRGAFSKRSFHAATPRSCRPPACRCRSGQFLQAHGRSHRLPRRLRPLQPNPGNSRPPRADRKGLPNAGRIPAVSGPARRTAWRQPPAMPGQDAKSRLAGQGRKGNKVAEPDQARDGAFGGSQSDAGVMLPSLRKGCALSEARRRSCPRPWRAVARRLPLTLRRPPSWWQPPRRFTPSASHRRQAAYLTGAATRHSAAG